MRINQSSINPLPELLKAIPFEGLVFNRNTRQKLGLIFISGGLVVESASELLEILEILDHEYKLIKVDTSVSPIVIKKVIYGNQNQQT